MKNPNLISFSAHSTAFQAHSSEVANSLYQLRAHIRHTVRMRKPNGNLLAVLTLNWLSSKTDANSEESDEWELAPEALVYIP
ncbi:MAG TPA: hypothetical protein PKA00_07930 [Saprospiraceae bacterium]|nr:hypothetical protein [Saprospiraceae bacterium]HMQ82821.1 hypothetical protein [Saprospiraceae bacterium]